MISETQLVIATFNQGKYQEIRTGLLLPSIRIRPVWEFAGVPEAPEEGNDFDEIARKKGQFYYDLLHLPILAEDSGLVIPSLQGFPGIYSARIAPDDPSRIEMVLRKLEISKSVDRSAYYKCSMVFVTEGVMQEAGGRCDGVVTCKPEGNRGFGYDPIFRPDGSALTFGMMDPETKSHYSHRGRALRKILPFLESVYDLKT